jgi:glycosyltransferase involved in cell wall biosynthesis
VLTVALDVKDLLAPAPRGWTRYARELLAALEASGEVVMTRLDGAGWRGPEVVWEQIGVPRALKRSVVDLVHAPNCFLPLRRAVPGVVTIHDLAFEAYPDDFAARTRAKFRWVTPRAARSAQRVICVSAFTRDDVCERYGVDPARVTVVPNAPSLPIGTAKPPPGPYLLGVGDLRAKKNWGRLVAAWRTLRADGLPHRLVLAGVDSGEGAALRAAAGGEPLDLPGYVDDAVLDALMRGAD